MDDRTTHEDDELLDIENDESDDINDDDDTTPADTDKDDPKGKTDAAEVKARQKAAWVKNIKEGKKTLDDMPENLAWLKKEVKEEIAPDKKKANDDGLESKIRKALQEERAQEDFDSLIEGLQESDITAEQDAQLREEYEDLLSEFVNPTASQKLKCLNVARRAVGIKDNSTTIMERRRKGRALPPLGGRRRSTVDKDKSTEMEKKLGGNLPPGYKA